MNAALLFNVMPCLLRADPPKILNLEKISHKNKQTKKISSNAGFFICVHEIKKSFKSLELQKYFRDRSLFMEGGEGKNKGGAICINKLLEGGAIKFFKENEGGGCN